MGFGMGSGTGWMWLFGLLMMAGMVLLVVVVVRAIAGGVTRDRDTGGELPRQGRARQLLDERYARGEISTEEYQERVQTLRDSG